MSERTVKVECGDQNKRVRLTPRIDDLIPTIRERFHLRPEEKITVKAIVDGGEDENDVDQDDDLRDLPWEKLVRLRIIQVERSELQKTVKIDSDQSYCIDGPMAEDTIIVQEYFEPLQRLYEPIIGMKHMTDAKRLLHIEPVASESGIFIDEMNKTCSSAEQIFVSNRGLMLELEKDCSEFIINFKIIMMIINEGRGGNAVMPLIATLRELLKKMYEGTEKFIEKTIPKAISRTMNSIRFTALQGDVVQEQLKELKKKMNKVEKELDLRFRANERIPIETAIAEIQRREDVCREKRMKFNEVELIAKNLSIAGVAGAVAVLNGAAGTVGAAATVVGTAAASVGTAAAGSTVVGTAAAAVGSAAAGSTAVGTAAAALSTVAAGSTAVGTAISLGVTGALLATPVFLSASVISGIVYAVYNAKGVALESEGDNISQDSRSLIDLVTELKDLCCEIEQIKHKKCCLITARMYIKGVKTGLQELQTGLQAIRNNCGHIMNLLEVIRTQLQGDCRDVLKSDASKCLIIQIYASLVALKKFARQCYEALVASSQTLEERSTAGITRQEVEEQLQAAREDLRLGMDAEQCECQDS